MAVAARSHVTPPCAKIMGYKVENTRSIYMEREQKISQKANFEVTLKRSEDFIIVGMSAKL